MTFKVKLIMTVVAFLALLALATGLPTAPAEAAAIEERFTRGTHHMECAGGITWESECYARYHYMCGLQGLPSYGMPVILCGRDDCTCVSNNAEDHNDGIEADAEERDVEVVVEERVVEVVHETVYGGDEVVYEIVFDGEDPALATIESREDPADLPSPFDITEREEPSTDERQEYGVHKGDMTCPGKKVHLTECWGRYSANCVVGGFIPCPSHGCDVCARERCTCVPVSNRGTNQ